MFDFKGNELPRCPECGYKFNDAFEAVDHMLEDDEQFDPALILPGGYRLMIGSLLRALYDNRDDKKYLSEILQSAYITLFTAETNPEIIGETVEDIIVESVMENFDGEVNKLFKTGE
jgi:predicted amidophosphoribosyltransferase